MISIHEVCTVCSLHFPSHGKNFFHTFFGGILFYNIPTQYENIRFFTLYFIKSFPHHIPTLNRVIMYVGHKGNTVIPNFLHGGYRVILLLYMSHIDKSINHKHKKDSHRYQSTMINFMKKLIIVTLLPPAKQETKKSGCQILNQKEKNQM